MSSAPMSASSVLPIAIPAETGHDPDTSTLTSNAPAVITGHIRVPSTSSAARAMPVGGHTGLALACRDARRSPSMAAAKYVPPSTTARATSPLPPPRPEEEGEADPPCIRSLRVNWFFHESLATHCQASVH